ncbi:hypothetical protein ATE84_5034 [Aquimarina sp. MAR_2010_214]|uniref:hypothetical protein n=1 Tax=Aquimarina sp. MAR_2010_214 TaxID=1250026 RepID=UPI000CB19DD3|nr:hypothetical protein [Aquimarina sp. MAR_2010_214]PKV52902.1 hypothetical protein ATE84_5034 [Aquimarina sp. MAR_2010_214]
MKAQLTNTKEKNIKGKISQIITKWLSNYITAMSKFLYPPESKGVQSKNDRHRIFHK